MAELQTIVAVFDLLKLAWRAGVFLKKVKDADSIAAEAYDRIDRLSSVLESVRAALQRRADVRTSAPASNEDVSVEGRISDSLKGCMTILQNLEQRLGGFGTGDSPVSTLVGRFKIAFKHTSIVKRQTDLEARINILQTNLVVLQLLDQAQTQSSIGINHSELLKALSAVSQQVADGHKLLKVMIHGVRATSPSNSERPSRLLDGTSDDDTVSELADNLRAAEDLYERYTSEHDPDDHSVRLKDRVVAPSQPLSPLAVSTPDTEPGTPSPEPEDPSELAQPFAEPVEEESVVLPLRVLNRYVSDYKDRAHTEIEKSHFNQAEFCLDQASRYSEARERQHGVPFDDRVRLAEELAFVYQKQAKWAEAVSKVHELMRDAPQASEQEEILAHARQNQLLASIYFDRHQHGSTSALRPSSDDLEMAEKHAYIAFTKRDDVLEASGDETSFIEERETHHECMQLLVSVLETRGKTVEASAFKDLLLEGSFTTSESLRRASTLASRPANDFELVEDRHESIIVAIKAGEIDSLSQPTLFQDLDVEKLCGRGEGRTLLMHAVECSDESTVHRLLDPAIGAHIDTRNRKGRTVLHLAAAQGHHEMVRCLLHHDADIEAKDNDGESPLVKAVQAGHRNIVEDFFGRGANMATKNLVRLDEWSVLHHAVHLPTPKMASLLLDLAPDLKDAVDQAGKTALHHCAEDPEQKELDAAKLLLEHKHHVDVNAVDAASRTALYFAASKPFTAQREAMVHLLLQHGATIDEARPPSRRRDYAALRSSMKPRRASALTRHDSVSTEGSVGTVSTSGTKLNRIFSSRMGFR